MSDSHGSTTESVLRELVPHVLGAVMRRFGDFSAAEDAVQEALLAAALQWPDDGVPDNPRAWLIRVACRRMTDHFRSELARRRREAAWVTQSPAREQVEPSPESANGSGQDDTLMLLFMCCHPALTPPSAIALTLRAVGGLSTAEIASAFLVPESTMAQRISRAKQSIKDSSATPSPGVRLAHTSSRPRLRPCTTKRRAPKTQTGRRSWHSMVCSGACRTIPW